MNAVAHAMLALNNWLQRHGLPAEGVRVVIEFPRPMHAHYARDHLRADLAPNMPYFDASSALAGGDAKLCGLIVSFRQIEAQKAPETHHREGTTGEHKV